MTPVAASPRVLLLAHDLRTPGTEELARTVSELLALLLNASTSCESGWPRTGPAR